ncbi:aminoacyl-tRNA hydrolase [Corynebacterium sp. 153RC1]|uniref:aminoacyl-tRNA hydrolase n=1 Tax=unclassified Corynebacterium TaxID=2624378 RepID=UPI00211C031A|nr:aminoacyl-tRNA hydrolase [Corynebacterium sp. 209RC1]MCQ9354805.1 aminoacyl-tRNA hydrolase [Corynebacterium sp. 1222RC1]MCQ9356990.1 aminoacyl-tRNA hydrolase [Corynebacterium sp. 122RC1]MCQ9359073.1 aminoacyl-tRNA hydrolase [Corynebacterium sp. 142RC1]MCQ9361458.1 aminoacyl-tRNA hydrolase [Corynebacterium sp. 153RC1]MCQ9363583.1 aminoacyl-tRNA hydrolase [Corynebacterium sp. 732RC1]MCQ9365584.1 aminoacyl-tRNA hydrolase [Corynebacterium sp. 70RC1]
MFEFLNRIAARFRKTPNTQAAGPQPDPQWLIVGLGNPGEKYAQTRHNVGYWATDAMRTLEWQPVSGTKALVVRKTIGEVPVALVRSTTFMNNSGEAVAALARKWNIPASNIVVLHDELDIPAGTVRVKAGGNENGHNGLKSTSAELGTRDYVRIKMGIGRPPKGEPIIDWVLGEIPHDATLVARSVEAANIVVTEGLQRAQHVIHSMR